MPEKKNKNRPKQINSLIQVTKKPVTIIFTDIKGSAQHWEEQGDTQGRLMVDRHNRLAFPAIKKFRGKVIKTIGDGIMASFKKPENALKAAIAIQQVLENERKKDPAFQLMVRIGIHTGIAIIEPNDIYGDAVNVAARVESQCKADEILASDATAGAVDKKAYKLARKGTFTPKGKKRAITVYTCDWQAMPRLVDAIRFNKYVPLIFRQKLRVLFYAIASVFGCYFLYLKYLRYLIADSENLALLTLNPQDIFYKYPAFFAGGMTLFFIGVLIILNKKTIPISILRSVYGGFCFCVSFFILYLPLTYIPLNFIPKLSENIFQSRHLFVEVLEDNTLIHEERSLESPVMMTVNSGTLILLSDIKAKEKIQWNKVLIGKNIFGWIPRVIPAKIGEPEKRLSIANKFYFKYRDLFALICAVIGFLLGFFRFRILPA